MFTSDSMLPTHEEVKSGSFFGAENCFGYKCVIWACAFFGTIIKSVVEQRSAIVMN